MEKRQNLMQGQILNTIKSATTTLKLQCRDFSLGKTLFDPQRPDSLIVCSIFKLESTIAHVI